jgi:hypothetical protein
MGLPPRPGAAVFALRSAGLPFQSLEDLAGHVVVASATIRLASCWGLSTWT